MNELKCSWNCSHIVQCEYGGYDCLVFSEKNKTFSMNSAKSPNDLARHDCLALAVVQLS